MTHALEVAQTATRLIDERLASGDRIIFTVSSSSMMPLMKPGDKISVAGKQSRTIDIGDIVLVRSEAMWLVHRVIKLVGQGKHRTIITKGDNHFIADPPWQSEQIAGLVVAIERGNQMVRLESTQIQVFNRAIAYLSNGQIWLNRLPIDLVRVFAVKCNRLILRLIAYWMFEYAQPLAQT